MPYFVSYTTESLDDLIPECKVTASTDLMDCFALTFDWQRSFETFVSMVEADKGHAPPANVEPQVRAGLPIANAGYPTL